MAWYDRAGSTAASAGKYALAGSVFGPPGTAIGAAYGAYKGWQDAEGKDKYQDFLRADVDKLKKGKGGLTGGQMDRLAAESKRDVGQQVGALEQDIAQKALSEGGGYGASGTYSNLVGKLADSVGEQSARDRWNLQKTSLAMAQAKYDNTMDRLNKQRIESNATEKANIKAILGRDPIQNAMDVELEDAISNAQTGQRVPTSDYVTI